MTTVTIWVLMLMSPGSEYPWTVIDRSYAYATYEQCRAWADNFYEKGLQGVAPDVKPVCVATKVIPVERMP